MQQIIDMIAEVDQDGDGQISYDEFVAMFIQKEKDEINRKLSQVPIV